MFTIYIRHTYLSIACLQAPGKYLDALETKDQLHPDDGEVYFRRTKEFNLLYANQRAQAGMALWALLKHLHSKNVKIGRLQAAPPREAIRTYFPHLRIS